MKFIPIHKLVTATFLVALLSACGGGGSASPDSGNSSTSPVGGSGNPGAATGTWQGFYSTNFSTQLVVLNTGESFGLYETGNGDIGALYGDLRGDGGNLSGFLTDFLFTGITMNSANISGTATAQKSMVINRGTKRFDLSFATNLQNPVSVASVAGTYFGRGSNSFSPPSNSTITISANGTIQMPQTICSATGSVSPHPNGQNVFSLNLTITGNNCGRQGNKLTGVLHLDPTNKRVFVLGLNSTRSDGAFFQGLRN